MALSELDPKDAEPSPVRAATRRRVVDFALSRLRNNRALQALAAVAFVEYGAVATFTVFAGARRVPFELTGWMLLCALGSWFFLLAWYPFLETLMGPDSADDPRQRGIGHACEALALGCVAAVHLMLGLALIHAARA